MNTTAPMAILSSIDITLSLFIVLYITLAIHVLFYPCTDCNALWNNYK